MSPMYTGLPPSTYPEELTFTVYEPSHQPSHRAGTAQYYCKWWGVTCDGIAKRMAEECRLYCYIFQHFGIIFKTPDDTYATKFWYVTLLPLCIENMVWNNRQKIQTTITKIHATGHSSSSSSSKSSFCLPIVPFLYPYISSFVRSSFISV